MKKLTLIAILIGSLMLSSGNQAKAQNQQGEFVVSAGAGESLTFAVISLLGSSTASVTGGTLSSTGIPELNLTGDYAFSSRFSLGLGIGYQSASLSVNGFTDSANGLSNQSATVTLSRLNIGLRPLFHFGTNPNVDPYIGFKVGVSIWNTGITSTDPNYNFATKLSGTVPAFQALFGLKGYFLPYMGAHFEVAVGSPYFIEAGLNFRFGNTGLDAKK